MGLPAGEMKVFHTSFCSPHIKHNSHISHREALSLPPSHTTRASLSPSFIFSSHYLLLSLSLARTSICYFFPLVVVRGVQMVAYTPVTGGYFVVVRVPENIFITNTLSNSPSAVHFCGDFWCCFPFVIPTRKSWKHRSPLPVMT